MKDREPIPITETYYKVIGRIEGIPQVEFFVKTYDEAEKLYDKCNDGTPIKQIHKIETKNTCLLASTWKDDKSEAKLKAQLKVKAASLLDEINEIKKKVLALTPTDSLTT